MRYTIKSVIDYLNSGGTSEELVKEMLVKIKKDDEREDKINGFITLNEDLILERARKTDEERKKGVSKPLLGVPIAIKDNINVKGEPTTCASHILEGYISPYDATVIKKLNGAGAVLFGKTNMDEFAMGSSNETSYFGVVRNPIDRSRVPGGSSGGSAAVVGADFVPASLGSDTGGSIRQPAAFCGVVGVKPTYGRVSRFGLVAFASSLDQIGPITKTVEDAALLLEIIAGYDPKDSTSANVPVDKYSQTIKEPAGDLTVGIVEEGFAGGVSDEVKSAVENAIKELRKEGVKTVKVNLPHLKYAIPTYYIVATAEASSNLERYDGVKYGLRVYGEGLRDMYAKTRTEGFGDEVKRRIMLGTYVLSAGYYDAYYLKALKVRTIITADFKEAFKRADVLVMPTTPTVPFKIGEITDPVAMYMSDILTVPASLSGLPAMSVPVKADKFPIGFQIIAPAFREDLMFKTAYLIEKTSGLVEDNN